MRPTTLLRKLLNLKQTIVRGFNFCEEGLVVQVAPTTRKGRCGGCGRACRAYDRRRRRWRHLDFGGMWVELEYDIRRVDCEHCGVTTEMVPWAPASSSFTYEFEHMTALLAQKTDKTTVSQMMGIAWATVGNIITRVVERLGPTDLLDGLEQVGIDEISYRRHHHYLTLVTDHATGRVVWVGLGKSADTVGQFFDVLGDERAAKLKVVTTDLSGSFISAVKQRVPNAKLVFDRFHVQRLAQDALDEVRREEVRELKGTEEGRGLKRTRWALQKNPWNLTQGENQKLAEVQKTNRRLYRAYLLKESLCDILDRNQVNVGRRRLKQWISWAQRCQLQPFQKLARTIARHADGIVEYIRTGLSNGRAEGINSKARTITKRSYGFGSPASLIGMLYLCCSGIDLQPVRHYPS